MGLTGAIDAAHAPVARSSAERLVFGWMYEPLVRADCNGEPAPAVADTWQRTPSHNAVAIAIDEHATFWNGERVTADAVLSGWRRAGVAFPSAVASDARTIEIPILGDLRSTLTPLAWPRQSVRRRGVTAWPEGTGAYMPDTASAGAPERLLPRRGGLVVELRTVPGGDARDLLDAGSDLVVTDDRAAIAYAGSRSDLEAVPLPWQWTYALLVPRADSAAPDSAALGALGDALAGDAVRVDARAATGPFWWDAAVLCAASVIDRVGAAGRGRARFATDAPDPARFGARIAAPAAASSAASSDRRSPARIVYDRDDLVARALAERLVALAQFGARSDADSGRWAALPAPLRAAGAGLAAVPLSRAELTEAMARGSELGYVVMLPHRELAPCAARRRLAAAAPWLGMARGELTLGPTPGARTPGESARGAIVPLIDVRSRAIVRRGTVGIAAGWGGRSSC